MKRYGNHGGRAQTALVVLLGLSLGARAVAQTAQTPPPAPPGVVSTTVVVAPEDKPIILDHVVAIINNDVLLESDVREEMRFAALQPITVQPGQNTHVRAAQRLINRTLMLRQMEQQQQINYKISNEDLQQNLDELRKQDRKSVV